MSQPVCHEYYSGAGGAAMGWHRAGYKVICIDIEPQPNCPFEFIQADALEYCSAHGHEADLVTGGPPCQWYSDTWRINRGQYPDLIGLTREVFRATGKPYVIENVEAALPELIDPILLCGPSFGLHTYRHRLFESNVPLVAPEHLQHVSKTVKMGRALQEGDFYHAVGNFSTVDYVRRDMGVPWMNRDGIRECIPPAYSEFIGTQLMAHRLQATTS